ncbi:MAG: hypothetical protein COA63_008255 [Methylophaga sp.]|nr:hypothetical protein [Methylophaga sp.]
MPKLDRLKAELHLDKQLIMVAVFCIAATLWIAVNNSELGWALGIAGVIIIALCILYLIKKSRKIRELLQEIEDC